MKIYIAAHSQADARRVAESLALIGHEITSTWLSEDLSKSGGYSDDQRRAIAEKDIAEVCASDCLVFLPSPYRVPGGKFVEVGAALGAGKPVAVLGHRENMLMWHGRVSVFSSIEDMIRSGWQNLNGAVEAKTL